jgi:MoxR domain in the MoxR-vWA-beta-propeller ternary systems
MSNLKLGNASPSVREEWAGRDVTDRLLGRGERPDQSALAWNTIKYCANRLLSMRNELRASWVGLDANDGLGASTDWMIATMIARENVLLIGPPGVAKSEMAARIFALLGLRGSKPVDDVDALFQPGVAVPSWADREKAERDLPKSFHYLLTRFSEMEEIFGPIEIDLLRRGVLARVNFSLLTGPGTFAAFLDEVFKANSSILNSLLTMLNERKYFQFGGMRESDLLFFIAASNEMPGGFGSGRGGADGRGEDFATLHAFVDRFPTRFRIADLSATDPGNGEESDMAKAFMQAMERESARFSGGAAFGPIEKPMPSVNDLLAAGRFLFQGINRGNWNPPAFRQVDFQAFRRAFLGLVSALAADATSLGWDIRKVSYTLNPRKLKALFKIALAHAFVLKEPESEYVGLSLDDLRVFMLIWDSLEEKEKLATRVDGYLAKHSLQCTLPPRS